MNRRFQLEKLRTEIFDIVIIGGGATGSGSALDAVSRGLKVALIERADFSSGTSSRSTKLIHGGIRYLEQAIKRFDRKQFFLVREALRERKILKRLAPHLVREIEIFIPIYRWYHKVYYWIGLSLYDRLAHRNRFRKSVFLSAKEAIRRFPELKIQKSNPNFSRILCGGVTYYDGQFDDSRYNISLAVTAQEMGAVILNRVEAVSFIKNEFSKICGLVAEDRLTQEVINIQAKIVLNAAGPFADQVRKINDKTASSLLQVRAGTHLILGSEFPPPATGILIPKASDGRIIFTLPWYNRTLVGTTDISSLVTSNPLPSEQEISYLLKNLKDYLNITAEKKDIESVWSGLRPLILQKKKFKLKKNRGKSSFISRDYSISVDHSQLITIAGGKWTTYRAMAVKAINRAVKTGDLKIVNSSKTRNVFLIGGTDYKHNLEILQVKFGFVPQDILVHLNQTYGDRADRILELMQKGFSNRLIVDLPFVEGEVIYAVRNEGALFIDDIVSRRTRISFLSVSAAISCIEKVGKLLAVELQWTQEMLIKECEETRKLLKNFSL